MKFERGRAAVTGYETQKNHSCLGGGKVGSRFEAGSQKTFYFMLNGQISRQGIRLSFAMEES